MLLAAVALVAVHQVPKDFWQKGNTLGKGELAKLCQEGGYTPTGDNRLMLVIRDDGSATTTWGRGRTQWKLKKEELAQLRKDIVAFDPDKLALIAAKPREDGTILVGPVDMPSRIFAFRSGKETRVWVPKDHPYIPDTPLLKQMSEWITK